MNGYIVKISLLFLLFASACKNSEKVTYSIAPRAIQEEKKSFLALGDSYTIGESVAADQNWPNLLTKRLNQEGFLFEAPVIIAKTGWRTDELYHAMQTQESTQKQYDLVSVLIGVNNQYQNKPMELYLEELPAILDQAVKLSKKGNMGVFAFSIPDYSVMPLMKGRDLAKIAIEIKEYNRQFEQMCQERGIVFYNITDISQLAAKNPSLVAEDQLHPSAEMYQVWIDKWAPSIIDAVVK